MCSQIMAAWKCRIEVDERVKLPKHGCHDDSAEGRTTGSSKERDHHTYGEKHLVDQ